MDDVQIVALERAAGDFGPALEIRVETQEDLERAAGWLRSAREFHGRVQEALSPVVEGSYRAHRAACDLRSRILSGLDGVMMHLTREMSRYFERVQEDRRKNARDARSDESARLEANGRCVDAVIATIRDPFGPDVEAAPVTLPPGVTTRETWSAEVTDLGALVRAVAAGEVPLDAVLPFLPFLNGLARTERGAMAVPGVRPVSKRTIVTR